jgi:oligopeptide transport system permease protein
MDSRLGQATEAIPELAEVHAPGEGLPEGGDERAATLWGDVWRKLRRDPRFIISAGLIVIFCLMGAVPRLFTSVDPYSAKACNILDTVLRPSAKHWFGTDILGCDYYARVIYGARASLEVGFVATGLSVLIALVFGAASGYFGGATDMAISRFADVWFSIPTILGAILLLELTGGGGPLILAMVFVLFGWPDLTRLVRSFVITGKERGYVRAARALGASDRRIVFRHILPNGMAPVIVYAAYSVGAFIAGEAALTFLGVGLRLPTISWGLEISLAEDRVLSDPHLVIFPTLFLCVLLGAFVLLGETLRDALDPRLFGGGG